MNRPNLKNLWWDACAATLLLWLPLLIFFNHHNYPWTKPESLLCLLISALVGLFWGIVMTLGYTIARIAVMVFLTVLIVDVQTDWITTWGLRLLLNVLFFSALYWILRRRLSQIVVVFVGAMIIGTLVSPAREQIRTTGSSLAAPVENVDLPFILHIILDEHIGIEGIPREFDESRGIAEEVRDSYVDKGFRVFGRAYSTYYSTIQTIPNLLNFTVSHDPKAYFNSPYTWVGKPLQENKWFEILRGQGYRIHVFQPEFIAFDHLEDSPEEPVVDSSLTFASESINALDSIALPVGEKSRYLLGSYQQLSFFMTLMREGVIHLWNSPAGASIGLHPWDQSKRILCVVASMNVMPRLEEDLEQAGPGKAYFVHLLMPHYPYVYERDCGIRPIENGWLNALDESLAPRRNDDVSRALRYPLYLDQVICTNNKVQGLLDKLSRQPWWNDAIVVVHGDHGSRIDRGPPYFPTVEEMVDQDFLDAYSTLFAIKHPGIPGGYDRRQLPLGHLFQRMVCDGKDPGNPELENRPRILVLGEGGGLEERSLAFFDHGVPLGTLDTSD